jgi:quercetin dioxygenase-like cupin family protein
MADAPYTIAGRRSVIKTPEVRVTLMTLAPGEATPWHTHGAVTDTAFRLDGEAEVQARAPEETIRLTPGEPCAIAPGRPHRVTNAGDTPCRLLLVQGVGPYDFNKI